MTIDPVSIAIALALSFISNFLFGGKAEAPNFGFTPPARKFSEDTSKLVGKPLGVVYGERVHVLGNVVKRNLSGGNRNISQAVALCWGPVTIDDDSIRINEKRPHYINGELNPNRQIAPGFIANLKVWSHSGALGQEPAHGLEYGLNRTAYLWVEATANDDIGYISRVECFVSRGNLFVASDYQTPIPTEIAAAFPSGISSSNVAAAGLDYLLNKDYGAGRNENKFGNFQTWIDGINHCEEAVDASRSGVMTWLAASGVTINEDGSQITKAINTKEWNAGTISSSNIENGEGKYVVFNAGPFATTTDPGEATKSCIEVPDYGESGGTMMQCTTTYENFPRVENVAIGLSQDNEDNDISVIEYGFHLRGDGKYEIWESGARIRNTPGSLLDPYPTYRLSEHDVADATYAADDDFTFGTYAEGDEFSIGLEGGAVVYYKGVTKVYTSLVSPTFPLRIDTSLWRQNSVINFIETSSDLEEYERRWGIEIEVGRDEQDQHIDIVESILNTGFCSTFSSNGVTKLFHLDSKTYVAELDRSNFEPTGAKTIDIMSIPNMIEIEYRSDADSGERRTVVWENPSRIAEWGETRYDTAIMGIPSRSQASRTATLIGRQAEAERVQIQGVADQRFVNVEPGDLIRLTIGHEDSLWYEDKEFWVNSVVPDNDDGDIELTLIEYGGAALFDDSRATTIDMNDVIFDSDPTVRLPDPSEHPDRVQNATGVIRAEDRAPTKQFYVDLTWELPDQPDYMHTKFLIYRRVLDTDEWEHIATTSGTATQYIDTGAPEPVYKNYLYAILSETTSGQTSEFPDLFDAYVEALATDAPQPASNVTATLLADSRCEIRWDQDNRPLDFKQFNVYVRPAATPALVVDPLYGGVTTKATKTWDMAVPGNYIVEVEVEDTFGNKSTGNPTVNFTMPAPSDIISAFVDRQSDGRYKFYWSIDGNKPVNFSSYELRYNYNNDTDWGASVKINSDNIQEPVFYAPFVPTGAVTALIRMRDTYGNTSTNSARIAFNAEDVPLDNILETFDFQTGEWLTPDDNWPTESLTGGSVDPGEPSDWRVNAVSTYTGYFKRDGVTQSQDTLLTIPKSEVGLWTYVVPDETASIVYIETYDSATPGVNVSPQVDAATLGVSAGGEVSFRLLMDKTDTYDDLLIQPNQIIASDSGGLFYILSDGDVFYGADDNRLFFDRDYSEMIWTTPTITPAKSGRMTLQLDITGSSYTIEYRIPYPNQMYPYADTDNMFQKDDGDNMWDLAEYTLWTGPIAATRNEYQFRVTTDKKAPQGTITDFKVHVDVEDVIEYLENVSISSLGTRLTLTEDFDVISDVHLTLQDDGGTSISAKTIDKNVDLGPLIRVYNNSLSATTGVVDAIVRGY